MFDPNAIKTVKMTIEERVEFRLNAANLRSLLISAGIVDPASRTTISFRVPTGGDYSGDILSIDEYPLRVISTKQRIEESCD